MSRWRDQLRPYLIGAASLFDFTGIITRQAVRDALPPADDWQAVGDCFNEAGRALGDAMGSPSFACPCCGAVSYNPNDIAQGYCGKCHWWTGDPNLGPGHLADNCPHRKASA